MNIITVILCYFVYLAYLCILRTYIYHIFCIVYSLYEFVDEKVENKLKSNQIIMTPCRMSYDTDWVSDDAQLSVILFQAGVIYDAMSGAI